MCTIYQLVQNFATIHSIVYLDEKWSYLNSIGFCSDFLGGFYDDFMFFPHPKCSMMLKHLVQSLFLEI